MRRLRRLGVGRLYGPCSTTILERLPWEVQETAVLCVTKYSGRNGGVVGYAFRPNGGKVEVDELPIADWLVGWTIWTNPR